jgi:hypothetical protein
MHSSAARLAPADHSEDPDTPDEILAVRRAKDASDYQAARTSAASSMRELLAALEAGAPVVAVKVQARTTLSRVGLLWEAAAHLTES